MEAWEGALDGGKPGASAVFRAMGHVVQDGAENARGQTGHSVPPKESQGRRFSGLGFKRQVIVRATLTLAVCLALSSGFRLF